MKKKIQKKSEKEIIAEYPIKGLLEGWYFSQREISPGGYEVKGTDLWGRMVSGNGTDPDELLNQCVVDAREITRQD